MLEINPFKKADWPSITRIYNDGLNTGIASFETVVPDYTTWNKKFLETCRLVAVAQNTIIGFAVLSRVSKRAVYKGVAEVTIYIDQNYQGRGYGEQLLDALVKSSESAGFWTLQSSIFPQNKASLKLHEKCGFRIIGMRHKIAQRDGIWHDTVLMERRSNSIQFA